MQLKQIYKMYLDGEGADNIAMTLGISGSPVVRSILTSPVNIGKIPKSTYFI